MSAESPRHWIEFVPDWRSEPMAFWVHRQPENEEFLSQRIQTFRAAPPF